MRVIFVVLLFVGVASCSPDYSNEEGDNFSDNWNQRQASDESSGSDEISGAALVDSGETDQKVPKRKITFTPFGKPTAKPEITFNALPPPPEPKIKKITIVQVLKRKSTTTMKPKVQYTTLKTRKPVTGRFFTKKTTTAAPQLPASSSEETEY